MFMQSSGWITYALVCQGGSTNHIICRGRGVFPTNQPHDNNKYLFISALGTATKRYKTQFLFQEPYTQEDKIFTDTNKQ